MFKRNKEDFFCENCKTFVEGDGYTNHCHNCLYSKHVDINPGDRASTCGGLMKPIETGKKGSDYFIIHQCLNCGFKKKNKLQKEDSFEVFLKIGNG